MRIKLVSVCSSDGCSLTLGRGLVFDSFGAKHVVVTKCWCNSPKLSGAIKTIRPSRNFKTSSTVLSQKMEFLQVDFAYDSLRSVDFSFLTGCGTWVNLFFQTNGNCPKVVQRDKMATSSGKKLPRVWHQEREFPNAFMTTSSMPIIWTISTISCLSSS